MKRRYIINIDQLYKIWQNNVVEVEFDGTEEELRAFLETQTGSLDNLHPEYLSSENIIETEEFQGQYEIQDIQEENI